MLRASSNVVSSAVTRIYPACTTPTKLCSAVAAVRDRFIAECKVQVPMLKARWKPILGCLLMQYVHGIFTQLVFRRHIPSPAPLLDTGFEVLPELGPEYFWISECMFVFLFGSFLIWISSPFFTEKKTFHTVVVVKRLLVHLSCCQALRILSFMSTVLPGPAHHCQEGAPTATLAWPRHWWQHFIVDVQRQSGHSCGDLIFSSHITFILSFVICHTYYSRMVLPKVVAWVLTVALSLLIIASHKHYTVDVTVAWYTVPLVFLALERRYTSTRSDGDAGRRPDGRAHKGRMKEVLVHSMSRHELLVAAGASSGEASSSGHAAYPELSSGAPKALRSGKHSRNPSLSSAIGHSRSASFAAQHDSHSGVAPNQVPTRSLTPAAGGAYPTKPP